MNESLKPYYERLKVPVGSSREVLDRAFREFQELYSPNTLGTYGLFNEEERSQLLHQIKEAYEILLSHLCGGAIHAGRAESPVRQSESSSPPLIRLNPAPSQEKLIVVEGDGGVDGGVLRAAREAVEMSIDQMAKRTKISSAYLSLIEGNEFVTLPARVYLQGFVRLYLKQVAAGFKRQEGEEQHQLVDRVLNYFMAYYDAAVEGEGDDDGPNR